MNNVQSNRISKKTHLSSKCSFNVTAVTFLAGWANDDVYSGDNSVAFGFLLDLD